MIAVAQARAPQRGRGQQPTLRPKTYLPPVRGLLTNQPGAASPVDSCYVLDNFRVTRRSVIPRGGANWRVSTVASADITSLFQYTAVGSEQFFVADADAVYPFTDATADETTLTADFTGQTNGDYSAVENTTSGGQYLTIVNGADSARIYNGTSWQTITGVSSPIAITGVTTADLSYVWLYRNRQFFIEKDTLSAWYLGTDSVSGAATELPLAGVFKRGGALLFGATLSSDSGAGLDDRCVFVTTAGEAAIYAGGDPASASDWALNGVYDLGQPLGKHAHVSLAGDLLIGTVAGLISLRSALQDDLARLTANAYSRAIESDWQAEVAAGGTALDWKITKWDQTNEVIVAPYPIPSPTSFVWVFNTVSGAWYRFTGWTAAAVAVLDDGLHFGGASGKVYEGDIGGQDDGASFVCRMGMNFDELDAPGGFKTIHAIRALWAYATTINPKHSIAVDYDASFESAPAAVSAGAVGVSYWDAATWDVSPWSTGGELSNTQQKWEIKGKQGRAFSVQAQITSDSNSKLLCELLTVDVTWSTGATLA